MSAATTLPIEVRAYHNEAEDYADYAAGQRPWATRPSPRDAPKRAENRNE